MAKRNIFIFKRRSEGKTNYSKRLDLLKGGKPRLVVRKSLNSVNVSLVEYAAQGDKAATSANSRELKKLGWAGHCGNMSAAYLTGLLCASKAVQKGITDGVADLGLATPVRNSAPFAAIAGARDGGLDISVGEEFALKEEEFNGSKTSKEAAENFKAVREKISKATPKVAKGGKQ